MICRFHVWDLWARKLLLASGTARSMTDSPDLSTPLHQSVKTKLHQIQDHLPGLIQRWPSQHDNSLSQKKGGRGGTMLSESVPRCCNTCLPWGSLGFYAQHFKHKHHTVYGCSKRNANLQIYSTENIHKIRSFKINLLSFHLNKWRRESTRDMPDQRKALATKPDDLHSICPWST